MQNPGQASVAVRHRRTGRSERTTGLVSRRHRRGKQLEFRVYRAGIRAARRWLPKRFQLEPMAYNRYRYEKLRAFHTKFDLDTFAPPAR